MTGLSLLAQSPLALWGLLTLLIPVAIHLLSKSRAKIIPFAHLALITVKTSPRLRQLRITQWLLLLLRILLLLIATLILAQLGWQTSQSSNNQHILLSQDWLNHASDVEITQLVQQQPDANFTLLGQPNLLLTKQQIKQWQQPNSPTTAKPNALNLWEKVDQYAAQLPAQTLITVYSTNRLSQFLGNKLSTANKINWQIKQLPINDIEGANQASVLVFFDEASTPTLPYIKAAFDALNSNQQINLTVQYRDLSQLNDRQAATLSTDTIINLSNAELPDGVVSQQAGLFTTEQLGAIVQPDFPLVLFDLLFTQQQHKWQFQNARLSEQQIIMPSQDNSEQQNLTKLNAPNSQPLHLWLILLLVSVFAAERLLSEWQPVYKKVAVDN